MKSGHNKKPVQPKANHKEQPQSDAQHERAKTPIVYDADIFKQHGFVVGGDGSGKKPCFQSQDLRDFFSAPDESQRSLIDKMAGTKLKYRRSENDDGRNSTWVFIDEATVIPEGDE